MGTLLGNRRMETTNWCNRVGYDVSNHNAVPIAEFPSRQIGGNSSGKVICIGMAAYDWYDENQSDNQYRGNIEKLTSNALDYLSK